MSTRHIILGLLRERPSHTYDVAVRFSHRLHPWNMNRGQVYGMMTTLHNDGLIEAVGKRDENAKAGPDWKLTQSGFKELERWFSTPSDGIAPLRGDLLAKLAVAEPTDAAELLFALDWYERELTTQLAEDIHLRQTNPAPDAWSEQVQDCISEAAILQRDAELTWIRRTRDFVLGWNEQGRRGNVSAPDSRFASGQ